MNGLAAIASLCQLPDDAVQIRPNHRRAAVLRRGRGLSEELLDHLHPLLAGFPG